MPGKDGLAASEQLRKAPESPKIPVVMHTACSSKERESSIPKSHGYTLEAEDCLKRSVTPQDLLAATEIVLKRAGTIAVRTCERREDRHLGKSEFNASLLPLQECPV